MDKIHTDYPSRFKIDEEVTLHFPGHLELNHCFIHAIHFTKSKVKYDIDIPLIFEENKDNSWTRIYNVDSCFVIDK